MMSSKSLNDCIASLRKASNKPNKFAQLEKKTKDRFNLNFAIIVGSVKEMKVGFDNHKNHARPHFNCAQQFYRVVAGNTSC